MGVVWEAWDERLERAVAVKQLHALPGVPEAEAELAKDRAMREARITARLHHPHAVPVFDAVEHDGQPCLIMQLLPSTPLSAVLRDDGPLPLGQVARIGAEIAAALTAAHTLGIVHRDVKPGNILITPDGKAHISDFGISHAMGDATLTRTGMIHGTPAYLAPEVARGEDASFPADVFSLGSTLYAALEGSPPFGSEGNSIALLHKVAAAQVEPPTRAGALTPFLLDMLSSEPGARPTMEAVAQRLAGIDPDARAAPLPATVSQQTYQPTAPMPQQDTAIAPPVVAPRERTTPRPAPVTPVPRPEGGVSAKERRRRSPWLVLVGAALAVALVWLLATTFADDGGRDGVEADSTTTGQTTPSAQPTASEPAASTAAPTTPAPTTAAPTTAAPTTAAPTTAAPRPTPTPRRTTAPPAAPATTDRLSSALTGYYALLPDDTAGAWPLMTAAYQSRTAGGRSSYEAFWSEVDDVSVSNVEATAPDRVVATLTYSRDNGRVDIERTSYRFVDEGGVLKIASSEVLSSRRR